MSEYPAAVQLAADFLARSADGDLDGAFELLSDDATIWIAGSFAPTCGWHTKASYRKLEELAIRAFPRGLTMTVTGVTASDDRVALECESRAELKDGRLYENQYHFLFRISDGRIRELKEYNDTYHGWERLIRPTAVRRAAGS